MIEKDNKIANKQIAGWLLIGAGMIMIQVLLGGITRLTESGLSITEWKPITGALPPLNEQAWIEEYKTTDQFRYVHQSFNLHDFKFIFFWEWFHRLWARLMGIVFLIGFAYFLISRKFNRKMILPMAVLFVLGALQGAIGWLMVKSGLVPEKYFVGHVELTTHFIAALILLAYTFWFALTLLPSMQHFIINPGLKKMISAIAVVILLQLIYGGFMAGLKAAISAPTWPDINGKFIPDSFKDFSFGKLVNDPLIVQFIHRGTGYILLVLSLIFMLIPKPKHAVFDFFRRSFIILILIQVTLGIISLMQATGHLFIWFAVIHQFVAMLIVLCIVSLLYLTKSRSVI